MAGDDLPEDLTPVFAAARERAAADDDEAWLQRSLEAGTTAPAVPMAGASGTGRDPAAAFRGTGDPLSGLRAVARNVAEIPGQVLLGGPLAAAQAALAPAAAGLETFLTFIGLADGPPAGPFRVTAADIEREGGPVGRGGLPQYPEPRTATGGVARAASQFLTGFLPALRVARAAGLGAGAAGMAAGAVADFTVFEGQEPRLSNLWQEAGLPATLLTDWLAAAPDDGELEGRFKNAVEGAFVGAAAEGVLRAAHLIRAARRARPPASGAAGAADGSAGAVDGAQPAGPAAVELDLARAEHGEIVPERDFLLLGDPREPLFRVEAPAPVDGLAKLRDAEGEVAGRGGNWLALMQEKLTLPQHPLEETLRRLRRGNAVRVGQRLTAWVVSRGGLRDTGGDVRQIVGGARQRPGLVNDASGNSIDDLALSAWELGYIPTPERPDVNTFLQYLERDLKDAPVLPVTTLDDQAEAAALDGLRAELDELGVSIDQPAAEVDRQVRAALDERARRGIAEAEAVDGAPRQLDDIVADDADTLADAGLARDPRERQIFVNWSKIEGPDDLRQLLSETTEAFAGQIDEARRGVQTQAETERLAAEMGLDVQTLLSRRRGEPLNAETALAARQLWAASGSKLLEAAQKASAANAGQVDQFVFRRMLALHHAIETEVLAARTETARALASWAIPAGGGVEQARAIGRLLKDMGGEDAARDMAQRLTILARENPDPAAIARVARAGWAARSADAIREIWINGLLSSPKTHVVNVTSNAVVAIQQIAERRVAEAIGGGRAGAVSPGEAAAMLYGTVAAVTDAFRLSAKALRSGQEALPEGMQAGKVEFREGALSAANFDLDETGALGRGVDFLGAALRVPSRLLLAEDAFFKTIGYRAELHAQANRQAYAEGLKREDLARRTAELVDDPPEGLRIAAADAALYRTFTNQTGEFGAAMLNLREKSWGAWLVFPFLKTPTNITRYAFERTPLAPLVGQWRADIAAGGARRDLALAKMSTGTLAMMMAFDMADRGQVSGAGPGKPGEREALMRQGWQPFSVKIGDRWYSYNRTDPFGTLFGIAATVNEGLARGEIDPEGVDEWHETVALGIAAVSSTIVNKTYLTGLSEFVEVLSDPTRYSESYVQNLIASFAPFTALSGAIETAVDPVSRQAFSPLEAVQARIAGLSEALPARRDLWGEEIRSESGLGRTYDFLSPVAARPLKDSPIDRELQRLGYFPQRIPKKASFDGVPVNFRQWPQVWSRYQQLAGNELRHPAWGLGLRDYLDAVVEGRHPMSQLYATLTDGPDGTKRDWIEDRIGEWRGLARQAVLAEFPEFAEALAAKRSEALLRRMPAGAAVSAPAVVR